MSSGVSFLGNEDATVGRLSTPFTKAMETEFSKKKNFIND